MSLVYAIAYLIFGSLMLILMGFCGEDWVNRSNRRAAGFFKTWVPVFALLGIFGAYVLWALNSLSAMDWSMFPLEG